MSDVIEVPTRGYRFVPHAFQYSSGLAALPGWRIERVRFGSPVPLDQGFRLIAEMLRGEGVPLTAFCACELRSPAPFTDQGFLDFNKRYAAVLDEWGVPVEGKNPDGDRVLVLWRNLDEMDNDKLDEWFKKQGYSTRDLEHDLVYVNGHGTSKTCAAPT